MNKLILILSLLIVLQSCLFSNCNEILLTPKDKSWLRAYEKSDTIIFKGNRNGADTLLLDRESSFYDGFTTCSKIELGPNTYNYSDVSLRLMNKQKSYNRSVFVSISKDHQDAGEKECIKEFTVFNADGGFVEESDSTLVVEYITLSWNKEEIKTFLFTDMTSSSPVYSFNWNKKYGLVRYEMDSGEVFELTKK